MSASMFPARAGMSRGMFGELGRAGYVPRASGDEPGISERIMKVTVCSPRERG